MATVTIKRPDLFPASTSVAAYEATVFGVPASGAPFGTAVETESVASDGTVAFTGLTVGKSYVLYASPNRYLRLNTSAGSRSGSGLPEGGSVGQVVVKLSDDPGDATWATIGEGGTPVPDATTTVKGLVRLAGHLGGTASSPTVPGLASKADSTDPRFTDQRTPTDGSVTNAKVASGAAIAQSKIAGLTAALDGKQDASAKGQAGGYASLDGTGKVPAEQLPATGGGGLAFADLAPMFSDVVQNSDGSWPNRPTVSGQAIPWALRWRSRPGRTESPVAKMAEFDMFLPVAA